MRMSWHSKGLTEKQSNHKNNFHRLLRELEKLAVKSISKFIAEHFLLSLGFCLLLRLKIFF